MQCGLSDPFHSRAQSWSVVDNTRSDAGFLQTLVDKEWAISVDKTTCSAAEVFMPWKPCAASSTTAKDKAFKACTAHFGVQSHFNKHFPSGCLFLLSDVFLKTCLCSRLLCLNTLVPDNPVEVGLRAQTNDRKHRSECSWLSNSGIMSVVRCCKCVAWSVEQCWTMLNTCLRLAFSTNLQESYQIAASNIVMLCCGVNAESMNRLPKWCSSNQPFQSLPCPLSKCSKKTARNFSFSWTVR